MKTTITSLLLSSFTALALAQQDCTGDNGIGFPFPGNQCCIGLLASSGDAYSCSGTLVPFSNPHYSAIVSSAESGLLPTSTVSTTGTIGPIGTAAPTTKGSGKSSAPTTVTSGSAAASTATGLTSGMASNTGTSTAMGASAQTATIAPTSTKNGASPTAAPGYIGAYMAAGVGMVAIMGRI